GSVANKVEAAILSKGTPKDRMRVLFGLREAIRGGKPSSIFQHDVAAFTAAGIEGTGFAGLDRQFWSDAFDGVMGDEEAAARAMEKWAGSVAAVLLARTGRADAGTYFRREMPEMNTLETRLLAESFRKEEGPKLLTDRVPESMREQPQEPM